jgi:hypothetical protein
VRGSLGWGRCGDITKPSGERGDEGSGEGASERQGWGARDGDGVTEGEGAEEGWRDKRGGEKESGSGRDWIACGDKQVGKKGNRGEDERARWLTELSPHSSACLRL